LQRARKDKKFTDFEEHFLNTNLREREKERERERD
jgi:hypothetical protein